MDRLGRDGHVYADTHLPGAAQHSRDEGEPASSALAFASQQLVEAPLLLG
jgi:hypothetical protein